MTSCTPCVDTARHDVGLVGRVWPTRSRHTADTRPTMAVGAVAHSVCVADVQPGSAGARLPARRRRRQALLPVLVLLLFVLLVSTNTQPTPVYLILSPVWRCLDPIAINRAIYGIY